MRKEIAQKVRIRVSFLIFTFIGLECDIYRQGKFLIIRSKRHFGLANIFRIELKIIKKLWLFKKP
jgi:hypothetical protein